MSGQQGDGAAGRPGDPVDPPPVGKSWTRLYAFVILFLAAQVVLFYVFTKAFE